MSSVYHINKGINKAIEFKGLKAQYIWYMGGVLAGLLVLFAVLYIAGINSYLCVAFILTAGTAAVAYVYRLSGKYGQHGMMKAAAKRKLPSVIKHRSRKIFIYEEKQRHGNAAAGTHH